MAPGSELDDRRGLYLDSMDSIVESPEWTRKDSLRGQEWHGPSWANGMHGGHEEQLRFSPKQSMV